MDSSSRSLQISGTTTNITKQESKIGNTPLIVDAGIVYGTSSSDQPAIELDMPNEYKNQIASPIITFRQPVSAEGSNYGIDIVENTDPLDIPLNITMSPAPDAKGMHLIMNNASETTAGQIDIILQGTTTKHSTYLRKIESNFNSAIYGKALESTGLNKNYAAHFGGNVSFAQFTNRTKTATENLTIDSLLVDGPVGFTSINDIIITVDWTKGNVVSLEIDDNDRNIIFVSTTSAKLIIVLTHTGKGTVSFTCGDDAEIKWLNEFTPEFTAQDGATDIIIFNYDKDLNKYFGAAAYNFSTPTASN